MSTMLRKTASIFCWYFIGNKNVKKHREKRSLDANALFWKLLQGLAEAMEISKDDAYLKMLESYGHYDFIINIFGLLIIRQTLIS